LQFDITDNDNPGLFADGDGMADAWGVVGASVFGGLKTAAPAGPTQVGVPGGRLKSA
jgi:hypothetical protein